MPWQTAVAVRLQAGNTIINQSGQYSYSGTPAAGNLVSSNGLTAAGTDEFGNATLAGNTSYLSGATWSAVSQQGGTLSWYTAPGATGPWTFQGSLIIPLLTSGQLVINFTSLSGALNVPQTALNTTGNDNNSGSTWVTGERAFMNNNWVATINAIVNALNAAGVT